MPDLLIELRSEEIPARMQARAREDLKKLMTDGLVEAGLTYESAAAFSTPRRLALVVEGLTAQSAAVREEKKGPATTAPDAALQGFLRSTGLTKEQLEVRDDKKGQAYFAVLTRPGRPAAEIVAEVLAHVIRTFPWPKSMRWGSGSLRWVRPLQGIICLLTDEAGAAVVPLEVEGIVSGDRTAGHRFLSPGAFAVTGLEDYAAKLKRAHVVLNQAERSAHIEADATNAAFAAGLELVPDQGLLAEVAGLVEWPVVLMGRIAPEFLDLPPEVLQTSMKEHQKFFSLRNPKSGRIEGFVTVANVETADQGATILKGNQKVLAARLSDAKFFWDRDLREAKAGMQSWVEGLKSVTFESRLGSQADRINRIATLAREIAPLVGADPVQAERAAQLAKLDLQSGMVGEFPELQGTMGRYYALAAGETPEVADAARDHWRPKGEGDSVPTEPVSVAVALADKIDTLTGFWAIDEKPTGSKDPFALRRAALGVIRLVLGNGVRAGLSRILSNSGGRLYNFLAARTVDDVADFNSVDSVDAIGRRPTVDQVGVVSDLLSFFHDRLKVYLRDQGIRHDVIDAVIAMPGNDDLSLLVKRAEALAAFLKTDDGTNLLQGLKRATNILAQAEAKDGVEYSFGADLKFAETGEERALFAALDGAEAKIAPAMAAEDFGAAMAAMAALRAPIDAFFTAVQVNADNPVVRRNRLNLLSRIRTIGQSVADMTKIEG
jgi:glycyl-tRNA synthetase beta chain